jgi:hypothetical protein
MKHTEIETGDKETHVSYSKIHPSGVLESVVALLILIKLSKDVTIPAGLQNRA